MMPTISRPSPPPIQNLYFERVCIFSSGSLLYIKTDIAGRLRLIECLRDQQNADSSWSSSKSRQQRTPLVINVYPARSSHLRLASVQEFAPPQPGTTSRNKGLFWYLGRWAGGLTRSWYGNRAGAKFTAELLQSSPGRGLTRGNILNDYLARGSASGGVSDYAAVETT